MKLDWQTGFPAPTLRCGNKYVWCTLDPEDFDIEAIGLCVVWLIDSDEEEQYCRKRRIGEHRYFYNENNQRYMMNFIGFKPMFFQGEPVFDYIAKLNHPTWETI